MIKWFKVEFWTTIARLILRNRIPFLIGIGLITTFLVIQWKHIRFTFTEANMLPNDHPVNLEYKNFLSKFGEEGNLILLAIKNQNIYTPEILNQWNSLSGELKKFKEIDAIISIENLPILEKDTTTESFVTRPFLKGKIKSQKERRKKNI